MKRSVEEFKEKAERYTAIIEEYKATKKEVDELRSFFAEYSGSTDMVIGKEWELRYTHRNGSNSIKAGDIAKLAAVLVSTYGTEAGDIVQSFVTEGKPSDAFKELRRIKNA